MTLFNMELAKGVSQTKDVLNYLQNNKKGITSMEAIQMFGATRLSAIIWSLRNQCYLIDSIDEKVNTRYKNKDGKPKQTTITRYILSAYNNG